VLGGVIIVAAGAAWLYFGHKNNYMNASGYNLIAFEVSVTFDYCKFLKLEIQSKSIYS
jgi:hypothetical protein